MRASSSSANVLSSEVTEAMKMMEGENLVFDEELRKKFVDVLEVLHACSMMRDLGSGCLPSRAWEDIAELFKSFQSLPERSTSQQEQQEMRRKIVLARNLMDYHDVPLSGSRSSSLQRGSGFLPFKRMKEGSCRKKKKKITEGMMQILTPRLFAK